MSFSVSTPFVIFVIVMSLAGLNRCAFSPDHVSTQDGSAAGQKPVWPKSFILAFHSRPRGNAGMGESGSLLPPNTSFATPQCSRLKLAADRSGETYAGHLMRERMRFGVCRKYAAAEATVWDWPWRKGLPRFDLPPRKVARFGAWQLRCEDRLRTRRCALVQIIKSGGPVPVEIVTHFTRSRFQGKLIPVWRIFALRRQDNWYSGMSGEEASGWEKTVSVCMRNGQAFSQCMHGARSRFKGRRTKEIWISMGRSIRNLNFTKCIASGCMVEVPVGVAANAYGELDKGSGVYLKLHPLGDMPVRAVVRADGFSAALKALSNIDRKDISVQAGANGGT